MGFTSLETRGDSFYINGRMSYGEYTTASMHGTLMNARFIQGIFDDRCDCTRFNRFNKTFDPEQNTDDLIAALPEWYSYGLRAFTVGLQGGGPCFTMRNSTIDNNPYSEDGTKIDSAYLARLDRLITAADRIGMAVIVSCLYAGQMKRLKDDQACINAISAVARHLRDKHYTNVIIEPCNEYDIRTVHPVVCTDAGMRYLLDVCKRESGGMLVGCSGTGGFFCESTVKASDVILIHGNGQSRNSLHRLIKRCRNANPNAPIMVNEDSPDITNLDVCARDHASWGYYNNMTKQEPPTRWGVLKGEDTFFARRMAALLDIELPALPLEQQFVLQGFEKDFELDASKYSVFGEQAPGDKAYFIRLSALYPERVDYVEFYIDDKFIDIVYDTPYMLNMECNWRQYEYIGRLDNCRKWAIVTLRDGTKLTVEA